MAVENVFLGEDSSIGILTIGTNLAKLEPSPKVFDTPKDRPAATAGAHSPTVTKMSQNDFTPPLFTAIPSGASVSVD